MEARLHSSFTRKVDPTIHADVSTNPIARGTLMADKIILIKPVNDGVVDGRDVTFVWKDNGRASSYRLQVAHDLEFVEIVYEATVSDVNKVRVTDAFGTAGEVLFWHVVADPDGDRYQSATNAFTALAQTDLPEFRTKPDPGSLAAGVEPEDIDVRPIIRAGITMFVFLVVAVLILFSWLNLEYQDARADVIGASENPVLREAEVAADRNVNQYGQSATGDAYRIPVDEAIDLMVNESFNESDSALTDQLRLKP